MQEKGTEKTLYGLDDINGAPEIIIVIPLPTVSAAVLVWFKSLPLTLPWFHYLWCWVQVEGEIDKLSLEEAGLCNCVSVPGGAPGKVSDKEVPSFEKVCTGTTYFVDCLTTFMQIIVFVIFDNLIINLLLWVWKVIKLETVKFIRWKADDNVYFWNKWTMA